MAIKGSLKEAGLADVCQLLSIGLKTGCLSVTDRSRFGQIYFDRGRITFASIINRRDRLGDLLVREGAVSHEQLAGAVDEQARGADRRLGEILLERGDIDAETLNACIRKQIEEAVYYLFTWRRGDFYFEPGRAPESGEILISVNPETLLLEGARRIDEWTVIEKKIPSLDLVFAVDRGHIEATQAPLTREQRVLLPLLDGRRSVQELAEGTGLGEFDTGKALYGLIQAGFATRVGRREADAEAEPEELQNARNLGIAFYRTNMLEDAEREFSRVLQSEPHDPEARHYLALVALRQGDAELATRRLTALLETAGPRVGAFLNLAYALRIQRRYADAERVLRDAAERAPRDPRVRLAQGTTALFSGDPATAAAYLSDYRALLGSDATPPPIYYYCAGLAAAMTAGPVEGAAIVAEGVKSHPGCAPLHLLAGNVAERRADLASAEAAYRHAAEEDPTLAQPHRNLGDLAQRRGAWQEAIEHFRRATETNPQLGDEVYMRMADLHYRRKERDQAIRCWRRALEVNPENEVARSHLEVVAGVSG
jgi:tetratricopeptide (TPR) repeat protein